MKRLVLLCALGLASSALAQNPEDEWGTYPGGEPGGEFGLPPSIPPPPPLEPLPPARRPLPEYSSPERPAPYVRQPRPPEPPNRVSMLGAPMLGQWKRGQEFLLGFPWLSVRAGLGLLDSLDLSLGADSYYFSMNELRARLKVGALWVDAWSFAVALEGGAAFFTDRASHENHGARWITGRRNFNVSPSLLASYRGPHPRAARLFLELRYTLAFDTEPFGSQPLEGVPPSLVLGHNVLTQVGAELPLSETTSFVFLLGLDFHGRSVDAVVMPVCAVGVVTGL